MSDGAERRESERVMLEIPIRVMSFGGVGGSFSEDTRTLQVNRAGARISLKHRVSPGDEIRIVNLENLNEADFRVAGQIRLDRGEASEWGVECLDRDRNIWGIDFPPPLESSGAQAGALLKCRGCGKEAFHVLTLVEADILESTEAIQKRCEVCGQYSSWGHSELIRNVNPSLPEAVAKPLPPPGEKWDAKMERRAFKRVAVKLPAHFCTHKGEEETSKTENISKRGLAVCLHLQYAVGEILTVACPYTPGGQNFFQKAEIRRRVVVSMDRKWLYGMQYL